MKQSRSELVQGWKHYVGAHPGTKQRIEAIPALPAYIGSTISRQPELLLRVEDVSKVPGGTSGIKVEPRIEGENISFFVFSPKDAEFEDIFFEFCFEILFGFAEYNLKAYCTAVSLEAYDQWKALLGSSGDDISIPEWRGLLGELLTIQQLLSTIVGFDSAVESWAGPLGGSHDFRCSGDVDLEIKTIGVSNTGINISSEYQLDSEFDLHLIIWRIPTTPREELIFLIKTISEEIKENLTVLFKPLFELRMMRYWDELSKAVDMPKHSNFQPTFGIYQVAQEFPRLVPSRLPEGVSSVKYHIDLSQISQFEEPIGSDTKRNALDILSARISRGH